MCILASIAGALLCWPLLALRRTDRLALHPVLFAKTSHFQAIHARVLSHCLARDGFPLSNMPLFILD